MYQNLLYEVRDALAFVTLNRPTSLNALDRRTLDELREVFESVRDAPSVRVAILTGSGRAFVAGADVVELSRLTPSAGRAFSRAGQKTFRLIEDLGKPVIAAVNGHALGGGCELAMACTLRIASEKAVFGQPEVKLGLIPGFGGSQRLARLVGRGRALEILLTGEPLDAATAMRIGLVNQVIEHSRLAAAAEETAEKILANAPLAVGFCLEAVDRGQESSLAEGLKLESDLFGLCLATADAKEGTRAFLEKRGAEFKGS
jgi:enoyl-CoA hydratase